ncbi:MAG: S1 RNA-binding domain-containing protein, partial [Rhodobacteraceae bacterium]|nr:S1 RNA-binding domain-containing protein [Paracoccaceae bacterium]
MAKKLLIDATHAEETRVVVLDGNKVEEFDFETIHKRQLAGNIYLAKVTRVEPSLQAAFVDYGGNRHGFLAFAEIHPDYYQIPVADRQALLAEERALAAREDEDSPRRPRRRRDEARDDSRDEAKSEDTKSEDVADHLADGQDAADAVTLQGDAPDGDAVTEAAAENGDEGAPQAPAAQPVAAQAEGTDLRSYGAMDVIDLDDGDTAEEHDSQRAPHAEEGNRPYRAADHASEIDDQIESVADEDVSDEVRPPRRSRARRYKIQEVIKVRQIMLVQVVKE